MDSDLTIVWKALSDPTRRRILDLLRERNHSTGELAAEFDLSRYAIMKHLNVLVDAELVSVEREGRTRWNRLNVVPLQAIYERWLRPYEAEWAGSMLSLKRLAEEPQGEDTMPFEQTAGMQGLHIEQDIVIKATPERVFEVLTQQTTDWYGAPYVQRQNGIVMLEPEVGGRLYEEWGDRQGALLATVVMIDSPVELRLMGPLGIRGPVQGDIWFQLQPEGDATRLQLSHRVIGEVDAEVAHMYTVGWADLLDNRLRAIAEQGNAG